MAPRRRKRAIPRPLQEESDDLFALLLEQAAPSTPEVWFQEPWKDGRNAAWLGARLIEALFEKTAPSQAIDGIVQFIEDSTTRPRELSDPYWIAFDLKGVARSSSKHADVLTAVLDMIQKWLSHSDGGGHVYNSILQRICENLLGVGYDVTHIEQLVRRYRARDAVGLTPTDDIEPSDQAIQRRLRAFESAWTRGLFKVAYCV